MGEVVGFLQRRVSQPATWEMAWSLCDAWRGRSHLPDHQLLVSTKVISINLIITPLQATDHYHGPTFGYQLPPEAAEYCTQVCYFFTI